jgi:hypothetical protein
MIQAAHLYHVTSSRVLPEKKNRVDLFPSGSTTSSCRATCPATAAAACSACAVYTLLACWGALS